MKNYDDLLRRAVENGMIDLYSVQQAMEKKERENYLAQHMCKVWQGSNGLWYTYLPDEKSKKGRKQVKKTTESKVHDAIVDYYKSKKEEPTIDSVFYGWINQKIEDEEISRGTYDRYSLDYRRFFADKEIASRKIASVTEEDLSIFIRRTIKGHSLTHKAYSNLRTVVLGIFKFAKDKKYTTLSISAFFKDLSLSPKIFATVVKRKKEEQIYMQGEIPRAIEYLKNKPTMVNLGILLAFQTGLRCGELAALKPTDIFRKSIHIQRQEIKYKDEITQKTVHVITDCTKTKSGDRYVILPPSALETLEMIKELNPNGKFLFEIDGSRIKYYSYNKALYQLCKDLGLSQKSMHKIRRTYGTTLIDAGVPESLIIQQMGHKDISVTKTYYYYSNKAQEANEAEVEKALSFLG